MAFCIRLMPVNIYDLTQVEAYLGHMALKGYFVKKILGNFASFEKGVPKEVKYRLEPFNEKTKEPPQEMLLYYEEQGWDFICTTNFFHLYQSTRADATEIHTDPITQGETFVNINKNLRFNFWLSVILYLFSGTMLYYSTFHYYPVYFNVGYNIGFSNVMVITLFIFMIIKTFLDYRKMKKLKQQLETGARMVHNETYKPSYRHYFSLALPLLLLFIMFAIGHYGSGVAWEKSLSEYEGKLPTISITELENGPDLSTVYVDESLGPYENYISYQWSELAPQTYYIEQQGQDISGTYLPSTQTEFYRLRFQFLAKPLFEEILDSKTDNPYYNKIEYNELLDTKFDQAMLVTTENSQMFFGRIGDKVIFTHYFGKKDFKAVVDQVYDAVYNFSET